MKDTRCINGHSMEFNAATKDKVFNFVTCNKSAEFSTNCSPELIIQTPMGNQTARFGDTIVQVGSGIFYVVPGQDAARLFIDPDK